MLVYPKFSEILSGWVDQAIFSPKFVWIGRLSFLGLEEQSQNILLQGKE